MNPNPPKFDTVLYTKDDWVLTDVTANHLRRTFQGTDAELVMYARRHELHQEAEEVEHLSSVSMMYQKPTYIVLGEYPLIPDEEGIVAVKYGINRRKV